MDTHWILRWLVFVFVCHKLKWGLFVNAQKSYLCNGNIVMLADNIKAKNRCNYVSTEKMSWRNAWDYCHSRNGWLVNCPRCKGEQGQGAYIGEELLAYNGVSSIWTGIHIRDSRLIEDDFPTPSKLADFSSLNNTGALDGEKCVIEEFQKLLCEFDRPIDGVETTDDGGSGNDGTTFTPPTEGLEPRRKKRSARTKRNALPKRIPENCIPVYKQRIVPCNQRHSFACYFSGQDRFFSMGPIDNSGKTTAFGAAGLDRKFYLTKEKAFLNNSDAVCDNLWTGGQAFRGRSHSWNRVILAALSTAVQSNVRLLGMSLNDLKRTLYWYRTGTGKDECKAALLSFAYSDTNHDRFVRSASGNNTEEKEEVDMNATGRAMFQNWQELRNMINQLNNQSNTSIPRGDNFASMFWPCAASLPLICELPVTHEEIDAPTLTFINKEIQTEYPVIRNEATVPERTVRTNLVGVFCSVPENFREFQSITLYRNGVPIAVYPYNGQTTPRTPIVDIQANEVIIQYMDTYRCEINMGNDNRLVSHPPALLRIQNYDILALHIGVTESDQYRSLWLEVFTKSLSDKLIDYTDNLFLEQPESDELKTNVFIRLSSFIERTERWRVAPVEFLLQQGKRPRVVFYLYRLFFDNDGEGEERLEGLPTDVEGERLEASPLPNTKPFVDELEEFMRRIVLENAPSLKELNVSDVRVYSINDCWSKNISVESINRRYILPLSSGGFVWRSEQTCAQDGKALVTVECKGSKRIGYDWGEVMVNPLCDYSARSNTTTTPDSKITDELQKVSQENVTKDNVDEVLKKTKNLTKQLEDSEIQPIDVALIADILQKSSEVSNLTSEQVKDVLDAANRVTNLDDDVLEEAQRIGNAASRLIKSVDDIGSSIQVPENTNFNRLVSDNLALEVWDLDKSYDENSILGLKVLSDGNSEMINKKDLVSLFTPTALNYGKAEAAILLPRAFIEEQVGLSSQKTIRLAMNVYTDTGLYEAVLGPGGNTTLNSKVIAAKILVNDVPITDLGPHNVTTVFLPKVKIPDEDREQYSICAYWDFEDNNGIGGWNTEGCHYLRMDSGRDVCICDHLTNFAVLMSFYDQDSIDPDHDMALGIISIVGLVLSIIGLSLSILSFLCIKKLRQGRPQQTLFNLSVALLLSWIVFLAGISRTENHAGCIAVAAMLHYFIMASFMWMLMEGILQYLLFVRVMNTYFTNYMVKTAVPAWGLPLIPVVIVLAIDPELYRGGEKYCWMSLDAFYYAFALPVGFIILTNLVIFILVVVSLCRRKDMSKHSSQSSSQLVVNFRASFICFFILGLSWIFGFLTIEDARLVFQYIFCISATLQGFVIFLMMTARDKNVRQYWKSVCCRCFSDNQTQKTSYRTWGDKGTGSSSNSGVQPVARHNKDLPSSHATVTTSNASLSSTDGSEFKMGSKRRGYGNEGNDLDDINVRVRSDEGNDGH